MGGIDWYYGRNGWVKRDAEAIGSIAAFVLLAPIYIIRGIYRWVKR